MKKFVIYVTFAFPLGEGKRLLKKAVFTSIGLDHYDAFVNAKESMPRYLRDSIVFANARVHNSVNA